MNWFRILGDLLHLLSFVVLIHKMRRQKSCAGISLKTQFLYLVVFICRYLDLPWNLLHPTAMHLYLAAMKVIFIGATATAIYYIYSKYRKTYNQDEDSFPTYYIIIPCFLLALVLNDSFTFFEVMWTFSIYLEALTILPQLFLLQATSNVETLTSHYVFCLGGYRFLYLLNWIYRYVYEDDPVQWLVWVSGSVQTFLYLDFFYYYFRSQIKGEQMHLPTANV
eukprot:TRINITY_DN770_c0_g1_i1.p1 TRINITY_DN770_c0_g1~~TRINITY_DN770_c0_g1_i1.p1  ORF type:complete len:222 (+),score=11.94 TRINITY_DN770_c0_g1_i1:130-795(+)